MMSHVVSEGTARRAHIDGIPTAGKTGTTNAYRDAWFVGFTGNFTCAVWYGNDDYSPTNRMTGGSLPAQTWREIMVVAHQGVEVKEVPGIGMGKKLPPTAGNGGDVAATGAPKILETKPGPAAGADQARRRRSGAGRKAARRGRQDGGEDIGDRAAEADKAAVVELGRIPDSFAAATPASRPRLPPARTDSPCGSSSSRCWR